MTRITLKSDFDVCEKCEPDMEECNLLENYFTGELPFLASKDPSPAGANCFICGEPVDEDITEPRSNVITDLLVPIEEADREILAREGKLDDRYQIYLAQTDDAPPKSYDEWLAS